MKKTDLLFKMLDDPDRYSEVQWRELLADDECRELYTLMTKAKSAGMPSQIPDEDIEAEWQRFSYANLKKVDVVPLWRKIAVAASVVVVFFGIAIAAVQTGFFGLTGLGDKAAIDNQTTSVRRGSENVTSGEITDLQLADTIAVAQPHLYDNVPLEQILSDLAARYNVTVEYRAEEARSLRLYYEWQPDYSLDKVMEMLNNFESFSLYREDNKLIVESPKVREEKQ